MKSKYVKECLPCGVKKHGIYRHYPIQDDEPEECPTCGNVTHVLSIPSWQYVYGDYQLKELLQTVL